MVNNNKVESFANALKNLIDDKEDIANKVTSLSSSSTDTQYPSAKAVYDLANKSLLYEKIVCVSNDTPHTTSDGVTEYTYLVGSWEFTITDVTTLGEGFAIIASEVTYEEERAKKGIYIFEHNDNVYIGILENGEITYSDAYETFDTIHLKYDEITQKLTVKVDNDYFLDANDNYLLDGFGNVASPMSLGFNGEIQGTSTYYPFTETTEYESNLYCPLDKYSKITHLISFTSNGGTIGSANTNVDLYCDGSDVYYDYRGDSNNRYKVADGTDLKVELIIVGQLVIQKFPLMNIITSISDANAGDYLEVQGNNITVQSKYETESPIKNLLDSYVLKNSTTGLLKNDGTVDTNVYLTSHQDISGKANTSDLGTVAFSNDYTDLNNKPTIPTNHFYPITINQRVPSMQVGLNDYVCYYSATCNDLNTNDNFFIKLDIPSTSLYDNTLVIAINSSQLQGMIYGAIAGKSHNISNYFYENNLTGGSSIILYGVQKSYSIGQMSCNVVFYPIGLQGVGLTGSYNELSNKPTIPSASTTTPSADTANGSVGSATTYAKADHTHPQSSLYANSTHSHYLSDINSAYGNPLIDEFDDASSYSYEGYQCNGDGYTLGNNLVYIAEEDKILKSSSNGILDEIAVINDIPSLTNYVQKSNTSGLLKNDGTVMTSGSGASNYATGNHNHTGTYANASHNHNISDLNNTTTVTVTITYTDNSTETINLLKYTGS